MNKPHLYRKLSKTVWALLVIPTLCMAAAPEQTFARAEIKISTRAAENQDKEFDKKFREGRDLIDREEWAQAAAKFSEVVKDYPTNKSTDAALYWLAFCYKKQRDYEKMRAAADRLLKDFPASSWTSDARVLLIEVAQPVKSASGVAGQFDLIVPAKIFANQSAQATPTVLTAMPAEDFALSGGIYATDPKSSLDRADEIRLAAFQSLLIADQTKGIAALEEILNSASASETLKLEVLRVARRLPFARNFSDLDLTSAVSLDVARKTAAPLLRDVLTKNFQRVSSLKVRKEMIYTLASFRDERAANSLLELYNAENDAEIKKTIINAFGGLEGGFKNHSATSLGNGSFVFSTSTDAGKTGASALLNLMKIARAEKNSELKLLALKNMTAFVGQQTNSQPVEFLAQMYDTEADETAKKIIIQNLARGKQPQAIKKLLQIARSEPSDKLKLEAIYALGQSKDPEALKYLEEIIK